MGYGRRYRGQLWVTLHKYSCFPPKAEPRNAVSRSLPSKRIALIVTAVGDGGCCRTFPAGWKPI
jgi:hypothetical protein